MPTGVSLGGHFFQSSPTTGAYIIIGTPETTGTLASSVCQAYIMRTKFN